MINHISNTMSYCISTQTSSE